MGNVRRGLGRLDHRANGGGGDAASRDGNGLARGVRARLRAVRASNVEPPHATTEKEKIPRIAHAITRPCPLIGA